MKTLKLFLAYSLVLFIFISCVRIPEGVTAVQNFQKDKYLGTWYEIARFDHRFEKNLNQVTANYSLNFDGSIKVLNKGFNYEKKEWKTAEGKAKFIGNESEARLKVSFFGPFYGGYNVVDIDEDYQNVLIYGNSTNYIWLLSRNKTMDETTKKRFLDKAKKDGFDVSKLIWVDQDKN